RKRRLLLPVPAALVLPVPAALILAVPYITINIRSPVGSVVTGLVVGDNDSSTYNSLSWTHHHQHHGQNFVVLQVFHLMFKGRSEMYNKEKENEGVEGSTAIPEENHNKNVVGSFERGVAAHPPSRGVAPMDTLVGSSSKGKRVVGSSSRGLKRGRFGDSSDGSSSPILVGFIRPLDTSEKDPDYDPFLPVRLFFYYWLVARLLCVVDKSPVDEPVAICDLMAENERLKRTLLVFKSCLSCLDLPRKFSKLMLKLSEADVTCLAVKVLLSSDSFSTLLADLQKKAMLVRRAQAFEEVAYMGLGFQFKDVKDYDPNVMEAYDKSVEAFDKAVDDFYRVDFPYLDLLAYHAKKSLANPPSTNNPYALPTALHAMVFQELNELQAISTYIDSCLENIDQFLNGFTQQPIKIDEDNLEPNDESIDTPLFSLFLDSDDDSNDGKVLNELEEYGNAGQLCR
nr:hypothetical protein [Tanacetum cinerariifolium]